MKAIGTGLLVFLFLGSAVAQTVNVSNLTIRVGRPDRERNTLSKPEDSTSQNCWGGKDNYFNEIQIDASTFYGYTANGAHNPNASTCRIRAGQPYAMGNILYDDPNWFLRSIVPPASPSFAECGLWLNGTYNSGGTWYGFAHAETQCGYPPTTKSMGLLTSTDGNSWTLVGQIISNPGAQNGGGTEFGEGDCTPVPYGSYLYLYCRRVQNTFTSVARAPLSSDFTATNWRKYNTSLGGWSPGAAWNGDDSSIGSSQLGSSASLWSAKNNVMLLVRVLTSGVHGVKMSFTGDPNGVTFSSVDEPIIYEDDDPWPISTSSSDLLVYPSVFSGVDGSRVWDKSSDTGDQYFFLAYTFAPDLDDSGTSTRPNPAPNQGRALVIRRVDITDTGSPQDPNVGVAISRWRNPDVAQRISSTQAVPYNFSSDNLVYETRTGYIMTAPPNTGTVVEIWECANTTWPSSSNPDHILTFANAAECTTGNYHKVRTAGWLYSTSAAQPPNTVTVWRCKSAQTGYTLNTHFTSASDDPVLACDEGQGLGTTEFRLGYALLN